MPSPATLWTVEMLHGLPEDGNRYEIIDGELYVSPAPTITHQRIVARLGRLLGDYVAAMRLPLEVMNLEADIIRDPHTLVQPDVFVIDWSRGGDKTQWPPMRSLLLAAEVLSPSTAGRDRTTKRALYLDAGVEYWIVDPVAEVIERWLPGADAAIVAPKTLEWRPMGAAQPLALDVVTLFSKTA